MAFFSLYVLTELLRIVFFNHLRGIEISIDLLRNWLDLCDNFFFFFEYGLLGENVKILQLNMLGM